MNKFIRYTTITNEKMTICTIKTVLSLGDHALNELWSPNELKYNVNWLIEVKKRETIKIIYIYLQYT